MDSTEKEAVKWLGYTIFTWICVSFWSLVITLPALITKKEHLDTLIVILSLSSLILNNIIKSSSKFQKNLNGLILNHIFFLRTGVISIVFIILFGLICDCLLGKCFASLKVSDFFEVIITCLILYFIFNFFTKIVKENISRVNLIFALWWSYILGLYIWILFK